MSYLYLFLFSLSLLLITFLLTPFWRRVLPEEVVQGFWIPTVLSFYTYGFFIYIVCLLLPIPIWIVHVVAIGCLIFYAYRSKLFSWQRCKTVLLAGVVILGLQFSLYFITTHLAWHIWGEKLMDMSFLQNFLRHPMNHTDPWMVGRPLHYYYWGYAVWGIWGKITAIPAALAYQIFVTVSFGLYCLALLGVISYWVEGRKQHIALFFTILLLTNISIFSTTSLTTLSFWKMSRLFSHSSFFMEFPWWSFLMQDFHPHFISLPLLLLSLFALFTLKLERWEERWLMVVLSCGLLLINSWDFLFSVGLWFCMTIFTRRYKWQDFVITSGALLIVSIPLVFVSNIMSGRGLEFGVHQHIGAILQGVGRHQFFYLLPLSILLLVDKTARKEVWPYLGIIALLSVFYFMDPLNSIFKFGQGITMLATILFIRNFRFTQFFLPIYLCCAGYFAYLHFDIIQSDSFVKYHPLFSKIRQVEVLRQYSDLDNAFLVEWPGKTYDSSRLQLSALAGLPTYIGQQQHILTRNNKEIRSEIFDRQKILRKVLPYNGREVRLCRENRKDHKIDLTSVADLSRCELLLED